MSDNKKVVLSATSFTEDEFSDYSDPYDVLSIIVTDDDGYPNTYIVACSDDIDNFDFSNCYFRAGAKELYELFLKG